MGDDELSPEELAAMDERRWQQMRHRIERGAVLYDAQRYEYYDEDSGAALSADDQWLLMGWRIDGTLEVVNPHMHRNCKVRLT